MNLDCLGVVVGARTEIQGAGLIKVGDTRVLSERLTYYTKLADG